MADSGRPRWACILLLIWHMYPPPHMVDSGAAYNLWFWETKVSVKCFFFVFLRVWRVCVGVEMFSLFFYGCCACGFEWRCSCRLSWDARVCWVQVVCMCVCVCVCVHTYTYTHGGSGTWTCVHARMHVIVTCTHTLGTHKDMLARIRNTSCIRNTFVTCTHILEKPNVFLMCF
jgi:hypothetical protein